ncbi:MAG: sulfatase-like hydrolase/transferase [Pirellulaceae bacterium]
MGRLEPQRQYQSLDATYRFHWPTWGEVRSFFCLPSLCANAREFLTGRYHPRGGVHDVSRGGERLNLDERTIAQVFKAAGYKTAAYGKWHNGMQYPYHPIARGFDDFYGYCSGHWGDYFSPQLDHNAELVQGNGYLVDDFTDHAAEVHRTKQVRGFLLVPTHAHTAHADAGS